MHGVETVTFDTTVDPDGQVVQVARAMGLNLAVVSVTNREAKGSSFEVTLKSLDAIPETGVWDESRLGDDAVWGDEVDGKRLERILAIITSGSFPTGREGLTKNQQHQLRDAMIFETHVRKSRDLFVTDDKKAFVNQGRRQLLEREFQTRIVTSAEFIAQAACRDAPGDAAVDGQGASKTLGCNPGGHTGMNTTLPNESQLREMVENAFERARNWPYEQGDTDKDRSSRWIEELSGELETFYSGSTMDHVAVFRRTCTAEFFSHAGGRSEFLFDILACQMGTCPPPVHKGADPLDFIQQPLLQVESELASNTREAAEDLSKLVCGSAPLSLFVGPLPTSGPENYLYVAEQVAASISGEFFCAFIQHPKDWSLPSRAPQLYKWEDDWRHVK